MKLTGITLIRNGNTLKYPWKECIKSLLAVCDEVWVNCDPMGGDDTWNKLIVMSQVYPKIRLFPSVWNMENKDRGTELAKQINICLSNMDTDWVLYLQADEFVHEKDREPLRSFLQNLPTSISQVELFRTYFWKDLKHRLPEHELWLGRVFRPGTNEVGGDGMWLNRLTGGVSRFDGMIYHYSRLGDPQDITARIRTLDSLFHPDEVVAEFEDFTYDEVDESELLYYEGSHPKGVKEFYNE